MAVTSTCATPGWGPPTRPSRVAVQPTGSASYPFHHHPFHDPVRQRRSTACRGIHPTLSSSRSLPPFLFWLLASRNRRSKRRSRAEPSNPAASHRIVWACPVLGSIRGSFWERKELPPMPMVFFFSRCLLTNAMLLPG